MKNTIISVFDFRLLDNFCSDFLRYYRMLYRELPRHDCIVNYYSSLGRTLRHMRESVLVLYALASQALGHFVYIKIRSQDDYHFLDR